MVNDVSTRSENFLYFHFNDSDVGTYDLRSSL